MSWFKRVKEGITTSTEDKKSVPDGLWHKCPRCKKAVTTVDHEGNQYVCPSCNYHDKIGSKEYFEMLFDNGKYEELFVNIKPTDPLHFVDTKEYKSRLEDTILKTGLNDALRVGVGDINELPLVIACMDFNFIGGSMGSVVGEKIARAIDFARVHRIPIMIISKSGGARMMEAAYSLMQMAKTSAKLALLGKAGIPYISLLTDPTTGGLSDAASPLIMAGTTGTPGSSADYMYSDDNLNGAYDANEGFSFASFSLPPNASIYLRLTGEQLAAVTPFVPADVNQALAIAGGLVQATATDVARLNVDKTGGVTFTDAAIIARKIAGLDVNP